MSERVDAADEGPSDPRDRAPAKPDRAAALGDVSNQQPLLQQGFGDAELWTGETPVVPDLATPGPARARLPPAVDPSAVVPAAPDPPRDDLPVAGNPGDQRWTPWVGVVAVFVVAAIVGYAVGWNRGEATVGDASSSTTLVTTGSSPSGGGGAATTATTASTTTQPVAAIVAPKVALTTVAFDTGIPRQVNGKTVDVLRGAWKATGGTVGPSKIDPIGEDAGGPRRYGEGPDLLVDTGAPVSQVDVVLVTPTLYSGVIGRFQDARNYWVAVADKGLANVSLILVKDGVENSKGFVGGTVTPGMAIGMVDVDGQITITINGQPQVLTDFFGSKPTIPDEGIQGTSVGLLAGDGQPQFDNLRFG